MTPIENRLRASIGFDAINGNQFERSVCGSQMMEAANEIGNLRAERDRLRDQNAKLLGQLDAFEFAYNVMQGQCDRLRDAAKKVRPAVAHRLRELRAKNDERSLQLTNDLADLNAALQEAER